MKCLICGNELETDCEKRYGVCLDDSGKIKQIMAFAASFGGIGGNGS